MAYAGASHEALLQQLVHAASKPAARCVHRRAMRLTTARFASTLPPSKPNSRDPAMPQTVSHEKLPPAPTISLHVGLDRNPEALSAISRIPIPRGERGEKFTPSPLSRPLGLPHPPQPGQNIPLDLRTLQQRAEDFGNYERAMTRRRLLLRSFFRPYFQERKRLDFHRGKSFIASERLFRKDKALYFPNIWGQTLSPSGDGYMGGRDTTPALRGKISIVGIQSGRWAEEQVDSFLSPQANHMLQDILLKHRGLVQRVDLNIQSDWISTLLVKLFKPRLRKQIPQAQWETYFMVKLARDVERGLTEDIRDAMGLLNTQVGYVYLLDTECRIRWAGSGDAWPGEKDWLNAGIKRLADETRVVPTIKPNTFATWQEKPDVVRPPFLATAAAAAVAA